MKKLLAVIVVSFLVNAQEIIKIKKYEKGPFRVFSQRHFEYLNEEGLLYNSIDIKHDKLDFYVLDRGNKKIHVFDYNGYHTRSFGQDGNGPGEWANPFQFELTSSSIIVFNSFQEASIHALSGEYLNSIPSKYGMPLNFAKAKKHFYMIKENDELRYAKFKNNGQFVKTRILKEWDKIVESNSSFVFHMPKQFVPYKNGYISVRGKEYILDHYDSDFNLTRSFQMDFEKIKIKVQRGFEKGKRPSKEQLKMLAELEKVNKFKASIRQIIGVQQGYIFLSIASDKDSDLIVHIIDAKGRLRKSFIETNPDFIQAHIAHGKIIRIYKNDEIGPYFNVQTIGINTKKKGTF